MFKQFGIVNSYTLESTFYAAFNNKNQYLQSQKKKPVEDDQQVKSSELVQVGYDFCSTLIAMIHSKIMKRKFTVDTSLHHLYQMNQKAFKKSLTTISSKDEPWQGFLGGNVPNRNDDQSKLEQEKELAKVEEEKKPSKKDKEKKEKDDRKGAKEDGDKPSKASKKEKQAKEEEKAAQEKESAKLKR